MTKFWKYKGPYKKPPGDGPWYSDTIKIHGIAGASIIRDQSRQYPDLLIVNGQLYEQEDIASCP